MFWQKHFSGLCERNPALSYPQKMPSKNFPQSNLFHVEGIRFFVLVVGGGKMAGGVILVGGFGNLYFKNIKKKNCT